MNDAMQIISLSAPLALASLGALASAYSGRLAIFTDGAINLSAFLCFAFCAATKSALAASALSVAICVCLSLCFSKFVERFKADETMASLALNIFFNALVSFLSARIFKTRGVLSDPSFMFPAREARIATTAAAFFFSAALVAFLFKTKTGLYIRISGSDGDTLESRGVSASRCARISLAICAGFASLAGCALAIRVSSFTPGVSGGKGWLALAAVYLGRKTCCGTLLCAVLFCAAEYFASNLQNVFPDAASSLMLSMPFLAALALLIVAPKNRDG